MTSSTTKHLLMVIADHYGLAGPASVERLSMGTNNRSYLVSTDGDSFILKKYLNVGSSEQLHFEHALLSALSSSGLPFAVPAPVLTRVGSPSVELRQGDDVRLVTLTPRIPGRAAEFGCGREADHCGEALAKLDLTLGTVTLDLRIPIPEAFGDLALIHPLVPHPTEAVHDLYGSGARSRDLIHLLSRAEDGWHQHTSSWSSQLIHGDFYPNNILVCDGRVEGVLDFEFAGLGYRAMDFAIGMAAFSTRSWDDGCSWPLLEAFATGYLRHMPLTPDERMATPALLLMREASSFVHWLGRMKQGRTSTENIHARGQRLRALDRWLADNRRRLVDRLGHVSAP